MSKGNEDKDGIRGTLSDGGALSTMKSPLFFACQVSASVPIKNYYLTHQSGAISSRVPGCCSRVSGGLQRQLPAQVLYLRCLVSFQCAPVQVMLQYYTLAIFAQ